MKKIKVLFVAPDFYPNSTGFANASVNLVRSILDHGRDKYSVYVYTPVPLGQMDEMEGIEVLRDFKRSPLENKLTTLYFIRKRYLRMKELIEREAIDVIFFETNTFPFIQNWALKDYGHKVFVRIHSTADTEVPVFWARKGWRPVTIKLKKVYEFMQTVHNIVSTSTFYLDFVRHHYMFDNVYTMWNGKNYGILYNTAGIDNINTSITNNCHLLTMGKMSENGIVQKGMTDLIKAIYILKMSDRLPDDFKLTIIGTGTKYPDVKGLVKEMDLQNKIDLVEEATHDDVFKYIEQSRAIVLLSRYEGQSMFVTESLAMGKPLVLSDNNGMQGLINNQVNGFLVKTGDYYDAAEKIHAMLNISQEKLEAFSKASLNLYQSKFSSRAVFEQFDELVSFKIN